MRLLVEVPDTRLTERRYVWTVLLEEFLGLQCDVRAAAVSETRIRLPGRAGAIACCEGMFATSPAEWLKPSSLPRCPVTRLSAAANSEGAGGRATAALAAEGTTTDVVAIYGAAAGAQQAFASADDGIRINFDLAGSAFFMLTRYEEATIPERDLHGRFPARSSLAVREGFIDRAVVNEYADVLEACLRACWPELPPPPHAYRLLVSHDVDSVLFAPTCTVSTLARAVLGDLWRRQDAALAVRRLRSLRDARRGKFDRDVLNTFDFLMDVSERHGLRSAFYFMAGRATLHATYDLRSPWVLGLLRDIGRRGHEVGLHPGYDSHRSAQRVAEQFAMLRDCAGRSGIEQSVWGGRQHFLQWEAGVTWSILDSAGLDYDGTVGFAEVAGFRSGSCREHTVFDVIRGKALALRERPLVVMETTLNAPRYMGLSAPERLRTVSDLAATCRRHRGDMTLLWHNSKVISRRERAEYEAVVEASLP